MRKYITAVLAAFSVLACVSGAFIYAAPELPVTNHFQTGGVDISLREYMIADDGRETEYKEESYILPGKYISKIPRIQNYGSDCYVRVQISFEGADQISRENLSGMDDTWKKAGDGFYYYTDILRTGDSIDVFRGVKVPADLDQETMQEKTFEIRIDADAVQSAHFVPDFLSENPWGELEIQKAEAKGTAPYEQREKSGDSIRVEYRGDLKKLVSGTDDFFQNIPCLMPGDTYSDSAVIKNSSEREMKIYFRNQTEKDSAILERIGLTIWTGTAEEQNIIYTGPLKGEETGRNICIGNISPGNSEVFSFTLEVPEKLNNEYAYLSECVKWIFSTEETENENVPENPKTGDTDGDAARVLMGTGAAAGILSLCIQHLCRKPEKLKNRKRKGKEKEK